MSKQDERILFHSHKLKAAERAVLQSAIRWDKACLGQDHNSLHIREQILSEAVEALREIIVEGVYLEVDDGT